MFLTATRVIFPKMHTWSLASPPTSFSCFTFSTLHPSLHKPGLSCFCGPWVLPSLLGMPFPFPPASEFLLKPKDQMPLPPLHSQLMLAIPSEVPVLSQHSEGPSLVGLPRTPCKTGPLGLLGPRPATTTVHYYWSVVTAMHADPSKVF
jgi:hypothetical protein